MKEQCSWCVRVDELIDIIQNPMAGKICLLCLGHFNFECDDTDCFCGGGRGWVASKSHDSGSVETHAKVEQV